MLFMLVWLSGWGLCVIHAVLDIRAGAECYSCWVFYEGRGCVLFIVVWLSGWRQCTIHAVLVIRAGAVCCVQVIIVDLDKKQVVRSVGDELTLIPRKVQKALKTAINMCRIDSGEALEDGHGVNVGRIDSGEALDDGHGVNVGGSDSGEALDNGHGVNVGRVDLGKTVRL